jgi:hypothetical protein
MKLASALCLLALALCVCQAQVVRHLASKGPSKWAVQLPHRGNGYQELM